MEDGVPVGSYTLMSDDDFFDAFSKAVSTMKVCKNRTGCFSDDMFRSLKGDNWAQYNIGKSLLTVDGIAFRWDKNYCNQKGLTAEDEANCIGRFIVDINGEAAPNQFGHDIFFFVVIDGKGVLPAGSHDSSACNPQGTGVTCAARVLQEDAIKYW